MRARPVATRYAVGLYRVSTAEQGQSGLGLEAQQASVRAFAAAQGWTLVAEHSDIASGKNDRRRGFRRLWRGVANSGRCWWLRGSTVSRAGRTRCRNCWTMDTPCAPQTCRARIT